MKSVTTKPFPSKIGLKTGFTILEMLVATTLLALISILLFTTLDTVTQSISVTNALATRSQTTRTIIDQMSRELQQIIPGHYGEVQIGPSNYTYNDVLVGLDDSEKTKGQADLHFIAVIDNPWGYEEVEVHYYYDGKNVLYKAFKERRDGDSKVADYDFDVPNNTDWWKTPTLPTDTDKGQYSPILKGVKSISFDFWKYKASTNMANIDFNAPPDISEWSSVAAASDTDTVGKWVPGLVRVNMEVYDPSIIRRFGSADVVPDHLTNYIRKYQFLVHIPRSDE